MQKIHEKTEIKRYKQKSLLAATAALLNHLISFPKKVQVHFGQDSYDERESVFSECYNEAVNELM